MVTTGGGADADSQGQMGEGLLRQPAEDSGTDTTDRYDFQYQVAARHCCEMLRRSGPAWILSEWHTDFVIGSVAGDYILVSVKHREQDQGLWTIARLCADGGLPTLRKRWEECGKPIQCRLVTNGSLDENAKRMQRACQTGDRAKLAEYATAHIEKFEKCTDEALIEFFICLRIESDLPGRKFIRGNNVEKFMRPALFEAGLDHFDPWDAYDQVVAEVRYAARDFTDEPSGVWLLSEIDALDERGLLSASIQRRRLDSARISTAIHRLGSSGVAVLLPGRSATRTETRLVKKLRKGGVHETAIQAARRTRQAWTEFEARYRPPVPGGNDIADDLGTRVLQCAAIVCSRFESSDEPYGNAMLRKLSAELTPVRLGISNRLPIDPLHLLGLAFQLTDDCQIWWSAPFDLGGGETDDAA